MTSFALELLSVLTIISAVLTITATSPIVAILYLIGVFVLASCYLVCLGITYVGLTYLVVYVGAVAVLFLFVVIMLNVRLSEITASGEEFTKGLPLVFIIAGVFLLEVFSIIPNLSSTSLIMVTELLHNINTILLGDTSPVTDITNSYANDVYVLHGSLYADASYAYLSQVQTLGLSLYTYGSLWLVLISFVLLLAMLGPIALCLRARM